MNRSEWPQRRSIRLPDYDYATPGAYFVTVCTHGGECILGQIIDDEVQLGSAGAAVQEVWQHLPEHYPHLELDAFVVMPNHFHAILVLHEPAEAASEGGAVGLGSAKTTAKQHALPEIVRALKSFSSREINRLRGTPGAAVWQRNYYEHIIRDQDQLARARAYIADNPRRWALDQENPTRRRARG